MLSQPIADKIRLKISELLEQDVLIVSSNDPIDVNYPTWIIPISYEKRTVGHVLPGKINAHDETLVDLIRHLSELILHQEILIEALRPKAGSAPDPSAENSILTWLRRNPLNTQTLDGYFDQAMSITHTADKLKIHRNTLVYRLNSITKSLGINPRIFSQAIEIRLAMHQLSGHSLFKADFKTKELEAETLATIKAFLLHNLHAADAAKSLNIHRNTLVYRLNKVHQLTGFNPRHFDDALQIQLALKK